MARFLTFKDQRWTGGMSAGYQVFRWLVYLTIRLLFGVTIHGAERVPEKGPLVVASNHSHYLDPVYVCVAVPRRVQWMAKKEIFVFPLRRFFNLLGAFPVDRQKGGRAAIRTSLDLLEEGWALGIFPEGTHRQQEGSREAKSGVVMLATRGEARVLPVYISHPPGLWARLRGRRLHLYVGEPMELDGTLRGGKAYREAADDILRVIYDLPAGRLPGEDK